MNDIRSDIKCIIVKLGSVVCYLNGNSCLGFDLRPVMYKLYIKESCVLNFDHSTAVFIERIIQNRVGFFKIIRILQ